VIERVVLQRGICPSNELFKHNLTIK